MCVFCGSANKSKIACFGSCLLKSGFVCLVEHCSGVDSLSSEDVVSRAMAFDGVDLVLFSRPQQDSIYDLCPGGALADSSCIRR